MSANSNHINPWFFVGAAVVGLVSAAGVFIIEKIRQDKQKHSLRKDLARLDSQLADLRKDLESYKLLQKERAINSSRIASSLGKKRVKSTSAALSIVSSGDDYISAVEADSSDLEFYDLSSDDEVTISADIEDKDLIQQLEQVDKLFEQDNVNDEVLEKLEKLNLAYPRNSDILWRLGKALKNKITSNTDFEERKELISQGINYCTEAVELKPDSPCCHKWLAILIGLRGEFQPTKERILDGHLFSQHIRKALNYTPEDATLHHLLGRFTFEIAKLSWLERTVAATLFAELPSCTYHDARDQFMEAERLSNRDWKENRLFLAKCELAIGDTNSAIEWLNKAENSANEEEEKVHEEVKTLLQKYKR